MNAPTIDRLADALRSLLSLCVAECDGVWEGDGAWEEAKTARLLLAAHDAERAYTVTLNARLSEHPEEPMRPHAVRVKAPNAFDAATRAEELATAAGLSHNAVLSVARGDA